tara:strand:- start:4859 stop:5116 length:258 start_codon:yes stop_codon:yes gene_type:complete
MSQDTSRLSDICKMISDSNHEGKVNVPVWVLEVSLVLILSQTNWLREMVNKEIIDEREFQVMRDLINTVGPQLETLVGGLDATAN